MRTYFYRATHVVQSAVFAIVSRLSVCPSVCSSVCDVDIRRSIGWVSSKLITRIIRLGAPTSVIYSPRGTPQNSGGIGMMSLLSAENLQYLWNVARQVPKSTTLDDLERPLRTLFQNTCVFGAHHENLNEDRPIHWSGEDVAQWP